MITSLLAAQLCTMSISGNCTTSEIDAALKKTSLFKEINETENLWNYRLEQAVKPYIDKNTAILLTFIIQRGVRSEWKIKKETSVMLQATNIDNTNMWYYASIKFSF